MAGEARMLPPSLSSLPAGMWSDASKAMSHARDTERRLQISTSWGAGKVDIRVRIQVQMPESIIHSRQSEPDSSFYITYVGLAVPTE